MSVVSIRDGCAIPPVGEPRPEVVARAEKLLDMARSGAVVGIAYVVMWNDECVGGGLDGEMSRSMIGEMEILKADIVRKFQDSCR